MSKPFELKLEVSGEPSVYALREGDTFDVMRQDRRRGTVRVLKAGEVVDGEQTVLAEWLSPPS